MKKVLPLSLFRYILPVILLHFSAYIYAQRKSITVNDIDTIQEVKRKYNSIIYDFTSAQPDRIYEHLRHKTKLISKPWFGKRAMLTVKINPYLYDVFISSRQVMDGGLNDSAAMRAFTAFDTMRVAKNIEEAKETVAPTPATTTPDVRQAMEAAGVSPGTAKTVDSISQHLKITTINEAAKKADNKELRPYADSIKLASELYAVRVNYGPPYNVRREEFLDQLKTFLSKAREQQDLLDDCDHITSIILTDQVDDRKIIDNINSYCSFKISCSADSLPVKLVYWMKKCQASTNTAFDSLATAFEALSAVSPQLLQEHVDYAISDTLTFSKAKKIRDQLTGDVPLNVARGVSMMINNILSLNSFSHPHHSVLIEKDTLIYRIVTRPSSRFTPLINRYGIKLYNIDSFDHKIPVKGTFKLNFSVGMAFLYNSLRPTNYHFTPGLENLTGDSAMVRITEGRKSNRFRPAIGAFAHAYIKMGGYVTPALTIGLSTNPTDFSEASYFLGLSAIFGHQNRFIFTTGVCGSKVEYLKGKYQLDKTYYKRDFINVTEADLSEKTFRAGMFFSVSYNLSADR